MADRQPLINQSPDQSDTATTPALPSPGFSPGSHALRLNLISHAPPPTSPPTARPGYSRLHSNATANDKHTPPTVAEDDDEGDIAASFRRRSTSGLGIAATPTSPPGSSRRVSIQTVPRRPVPVGGRSPVKSPNALSPPGTGDPLLGGFPKDSPENTPDLRRERCSPRDDGGDYESFRRSGLKHARTSSTSLNDYQQYLDSADTQRLRGAPSIKSAYETSFRPNQECPTARDFYQSRFTWLSVTVIIICLFSTVFSGIFLGLAIKGPRWGRKITTHGPLKPADAIVLTSIMAKLIEISFVTSFVAFLGQVLSRRAFMKEQGRGVTLSELSMWRWVVQPGTLITHWETAKYAGVTLLGILSLLSAVLATMYAPAASAVVQPVLKFGKWEHKNMTGLVKTQVANLLHVQDICQTPIRDDKEFGGTTCLQIEHAGQGYHNYQRYLAFWDNEASSGNGTDDQRYRPPGFGLLYENTTVTAQWINIINTTEVSKKYGRAINNVSLAMPHSGVFQAARNQVNDILQPEELNSEGLYYLRASAVSPVMNVLCANMNKDELKPIVYDEWNDDVVNGTTWLKLSAGLSTDNKTVVDDIFGWTKADKTRKIDYPPIFAKLPLEFNTIMNHTSQFWGRDAIYLLGQGGKTDGPDLTGEYVLCKIHVTLTPNCSTHYNATGTGGSMRAVCEDDKEPMIYLKSNPKAPDVTPVPNWRDIGFDWANSLSLNTGISDNNASNSRLLTQLILTPENKDPKNYQVKLNPALPSVAEVIAVMSGCTLLKSMQDAPFGPDYDYTLPLLKTPQPQNFNALLMAQQYGSGGADHASKGWVLILFLVFLLDVFVLVYFLLHRGLVTDFSEPPNLFALAVNSPPSHLLAGSCGGGPAGKQYVVNWFVNTEGDHLYMEPGAKPVDEDGHGHAHGTPHVHVHAPDDTARHPDPGAASRPGFFTRVAVWFNALREKGVRFGPAAQQARLRPASVVEVDMELEDGSSKTQRQYAKLAKRRSML